MPEALSDTLVRVLLPKLVEALRPIIRAEVLQALKDEDGMITQAEARKIARVRHAAIQLACDLPRDQEGHLPSVPSRKGHGALRNRTHRLISRRDLARWIERHHRSLA